MARIGPKPVITMVKLKASLKAILDNPLKPTARGKSNGEIRWQVQRDKTKIASVQSTQNYKRQWKYGGDLENA